MASENKKLIDRLLSDLEEYKQNNFFKNIYENILFSDAEATIDEHFLKQEIDIEWIQAIEKCIIPLDNIIRTPRKFIKNEEDIVPIALARGITTDSIKHLAQHTNMIQSVDHDMVTPNKILEVRKEESYETYENRFIYTLLIKLQYFLDKRMQIINEKVSMDNEYNISYKGSFGFDKDKVNYQIIFNYTNPNKTDIDDLDKLIKQDVEKLSNIQRIERLRKILYDFQGSGFMKQLVGVPQVRPPLTITNLLAKNPDYKACVDLWIFIENYRNTGVKLKVVDQKENPGKEVFDRLSSLTATFYSYLRSYTTGLQDSLMEEKDNSKDNIINERIEQIINNYDFEINEIKRIFIDKVERKKRSLNASERRMVAIIKEAINDEKDYKSIRQEKLQKIRLEKLRIQKLVEAKLKKEKEEAERLEKERLEKERLEAERIAQEEAKRLEKERIAKLVEEQLEKERLEKARLEQERLEQERLEAERIAKEEAERIEKERQEKLVQEELDKKNRIKEIRKLQKDKYVIYDQDTLNLIEPKLVKSKKKK